MTVAELETMIVMILIEVGIFAFMMFMLGYFVDKFFTEDR